MMISTDWKTLAACTLHNICIMSERDIEHFSDNDDDNQQDNGMDGRDEDGDCSLEETNTAGHPGESRKNIVKRKCDLIAEQLWEHCIVVT